MSVLSCSSASAPSRHNNTPSGVQTYRRTHRSYEEHRLTCFLMIVLRALKGSGPKYISDLCSVFTGHGGPCLFTAPRVHNKHGQAHFTLYAREEPSEISLSHSLSLFPGNGWYLMESCPNKGALIQIRQTLAQIIISVTRLFNSLLIIIDARNIFLHIETVCTIWLNKIMTNIIFKVTRGI